MSMSQEPMNLAVVRRRVQFITNRTITNLKARTGCRCRVTTELLANYDGFRVHVLAIYPCRQHMGSSPRTESLWARELESEANDQIARSLARAGMGTN